MYADTLADGDQSVLSAVCLANIFDTERTSSMDTSSCEFDLSDLLFADDARRRTFNSGYSCGLALK